MRLFARFCMIKCGVWGNDGTRSANCGRSNVICYTQDMDSPSYAVPSEAFRNELGKLPKHYAYVLVFHLSKNNLPYILEWVRTVNVIAVISIPYSEKPAVKAAVSAVTTVHSPQLENISDCIVKVCAEHIAEEIIVIEIGGYSASVSELLPNVALSVEDTTRGHERFKQYEQTLTYPVVSIARMAGKQQANESVGAAIAESTSFVLKQLEQSIETKNIAVLGYGGVGRATARQLQQAGVAVDVFDTDAARLSLAIEDGFSFKERAAIIADADVIIGCSGYQSIQQEDIAQFKEDVVLISASSKQVEFPYGLFQDQSLDSAKDGVLEEFTMGAKSFKVAHQGQPINFYFDIPLGQVFDTPMTLLAQSVLYGTSTTLEPKLYSLPG